MFLESPAITKDKTSRDVVFRLIGVLVQRYNHSLGSWNDYDHQIQIMNRIARSHHVHHPFASAL